MRNFWESWNHKKTAKKMLGGTFSNLFTVAGDNTMSPNIFTMYLTSPLHYNVTLLSSDSQT